MTIVLTFGMLRMRPWKVGAATAMAWSKKRVVLSVGGRFTSDGEDGQMAGRGGGNDDWMTRQGRAVRCRRGGAPRTRLDRATIVF